MSSSNLTLQAQLNPEQLEAKQSLKEDTTNINQGSSIVGKETLLKKGGEIEVSHVQTKSLCQEVQSGGKVQQKSQILGNEVKVDGALKIEGSSAVAASVQIRSNDKRPFHVEQLSQIIGDSSEINAPLKLKGVQSIAGGVGVMSSQRSHSFGVRLPINFEQGQKERLSMLAAGWSRELNRVAEPDSYDALVKDSPASRRSATIFGDNAHINSPVHIESSVVQTTIEQQALPKPLSHLPEIWHLPPKNGNFVGRTSLLSEVTNHLQQVDQLVLLTAFHGLGGVGKTQVALEFVHRNENYKNYQGVVWFNAENRDQLQQEYIELGHELHILYGYEKAPIWEQAKHVKAWLEDPSRAGWLLVYDNAPEYGGEKGIGYLIPTKQGKVLITSRYKIGWPQHSIDVNVFTPEESKAYIEKVLGQALSDKNRSKCSELAATLGHLPLALAQSVAYIKKNRLNLTRYLELYETRKQTLLADATLSRETLPPDSARMIVFITWDITMDKIHMESPLAENWLQSCAYLRNKDIPDFLFEKFSEDQANNPKDEIYDTARGTLHSYSMIDVDGKNRRISIHNVLQEVIRLKLASESKDEGIVVNTARLLQKCFPEGESMEDFAKKKELLPHFEALFPSLATIKKRMKFSKESHEIVFLQHLAYQTKAYYSLGLPEKQKELQERALEIQEKDYGSDHCEVAWILGNLGNAYGYLGAPHKQKELLERALKILEHYFGTDHFAVAITLFYLGIAYGSLGSPDKQKELLERALKIQEQHYGSDHFEVVRTLVYLGNAYSYLGASEKQKELLERALKIQEHNNCSDSCEVAWILSNLGNAYGSLGAPEKKKVLLERALKILEHYYDSDHFVVASSLVYLGISYGSLGSPEKQKELLERAIKIQEQLYGSDHFVVASSLVILGNAYGSLGAPEKQKELLNRAIKIQEKHYGSNNFEVARAFDCLGNAYGKLGEPDKQKELLERALKIQEQHYGPDYIEVASSLVNLGNAYGSLGSPKKQKELLERAIQIQEKHYGPDHFEVARTFDCLGNAYGSLGAHEKQKKLLERALIIRELHYGPNHFEVASSLINLSIAYADFGAPEKQKELVERAIQIQEKHYGPDHFEVARAFDCLGNAYGSLGAHEKQKELLERALIIRELHYGPDHFEVASSLVNLSIAYGDLGVPEKQRELLERALKIQEHYYGSDHFEVARTLLNLSNVYGYFRAPKKQKELLERALKIQEHHYGSDHFEVARTFGNLSIAYGDLGVPQKQKELLEQALKIQENHYGPDHFEVAKTLGNLSNVYGSFGAPKKQKELLERALKIQEHHYGSDHFEVARTLVNLSISYRFLGAPEKQKELLERALEINEHYYGSNHFEIAFILVNLGNAYGDFGNIQKACETYEKASSISEKETPLQLAAKSGNLETVKYFFAKGMDVFARNSHDTLLHQAVSGNNKEIIKLILDKIKEKDPQNFLEHINAKDTEGDTPLMWAAEKCNAIAAKTLLDYGVDINAIDNDGQTALHEATNFRYDNDGAASQDYLKFIQLLLDHHADPNISDKNGKIPLDLAQKKSEQDQKNENFKVITALLLSVTDELNLCKRKNTLVGESNHPLPLM